MGISWDTVHVGIPNAQGPALGSEILRGSQENAGSRGSRAFRQHIAIVRLRLSSIITMADIDFFSDLLPSKLPASSASGLDGIDDIFAAESPVLAQAVSGSPRSAPTQTNGDLGASQLGRGERAESESGRSPAPMGFSAGKREAQHVEAVLARFASGLEKVLQDTNRCEQLLIIIPVALDALAVSSQSCRGACATSASHKS